MNIFKCVVGRSEKNQIEKAKKAEKRLAENKYVSEYVKQKDIELVAEVSARAKIREWVENHIDIAEKTKNGDYFISMKVPYYNQDTRKYEPLDAKVYAYYVDGGGTLNGRKIVDWHHWISCSKDFCGQRLDWNPTLFADILNNQGRIEEWCKEYNECC